MRDVSVELGTDAYRQARALAIFAIALYPVGMLFVTFALLLAARRAIVSKRHTPFSRSLAFLYNGFEPHMWWWECVEMGRRFVLVGVLVTMDDTVLRVITGTVLSALFLLVQVPRWPSFFASPLRPSFVLHARFLQHPPLPVIH